MGFSSPCIGTPAGFGQGGAMGGSSGSNGSSANISSSNSSINLIPRVQYEHLVILWTVCFVPRKRKLLLFFKFNPHNKDTPLIRTLSVAPLCPY